MLLFALAVVAIVAAVNLALALIWIWANGEPLAGSHDYPAGFFATNTLVTLALIGGGTLIQSWNLRDGGDAVARMAGGRPVLPASRDLAERRLLNVVEEMALAAGIACPKVYLLDKEEAINAFAAGHNPNEAVIAVTRGALKRLNRDELQGVVGHEFSHILNGDMRLNVNLIGVLFGIQMVAGFGRTLMEFGGRVWGRRGRDEKGASGQAIVVVIGLVLFVVGYIGIFFGRLIKAAVSRQREFLADASAVQFTRNPDGIGGALRKIGGLARNDGPGSRIAHPNAEQLSHLFLGAAQPRLAGGWLATHPPLAERLRRIYGRSVELLDAPEIPEPPLRPSRCCRTSRISCRPPRPCRRLRQHRHRWQRRPRPRSNSAITRQRRPPCRSNSATPCTSRRQRAHWCMPCCSDRRRSGRRRWHCWRRPSRRKPSWPPIWCRRSSGCRKARACRCSTWRCRPCASCRHRSAPPCWPSSSS